MAKKSKSELAAEGKEIKEILSAAKQTPHSFALFHGPDDLIFHAHKTKSKSQMRQLCKADGASQKGAVGMLDGSAGTVIDLVVEDPDSTPANFAKAFRKFLQVRGISKKVRLISEDGGVLDDGEDPEDASDPSGGGAAAKSADDAPDIGDDIDIVIARLRKAFEAMGTPLVRSLKSAPKSYKVKLDSAIDLFRKAMKAKNPDQAKKALLALNKLVNATPSVVRIDDQVKAAAGDPEKLGKLDGMVNACKAQSATAEGEAFINGALPELKALRGALKDAIDKDPPPANIDDLKTMKAAMDDMFYDRQNKPPRQHGPQMHGPGLTTANLEDRIKRRRNPRTGERMRGPKVYSASSFTDKGAYVDCQIAMREKALKIVEDGTVTKPEEGEGPVRLPPIIGKLSEVIGPNWETAVQGVKQRKRAGQKVYELATWGPDSLCEAFYDLTSDGTLELVTLYPSAVAPPPAPAPVVAPPQPQPRPANPRPRRRRRRRRGNGGGGAGGDT